ncbi:MAG: hypothetical protein ACI8ZN_001971 [Bacteroidia bacterium]
MKRKLLKALVLSLCIGMGWFVGYLRIPQVDGKNAFFAGFIACLGVLVFVVLLAAFWGRKLSFGSTSSAPNVDSVKRDRKVWGMVLIATAVAILSCYIIIEKQKKEYKALISSQNQQLEVQIILQKSILAINSFAEISRMVDSIKFEMAGSTWKGISESSLYKISSLSEAFKPYRYTECDCDTLVELSPERGQLLLALIAIELDSTSFAQIKKRTNFSQAALCNRDLRYTDLSGINLRRACLKNIQLTGVDLSYSNLRESNLWGAQIDSANLSHSDLRRAVGSFSSLVASDLSYSNLDGLELDGANCTHCSMQGSKVTVANFKSAKMNGSNMTYCDFAWTNFSYADVRESNFSESRLRQSVIHHANFNDANLHTTRVQESWVDELMTWDVIGTEYILNKYDLIIDPVISQQTKLRLK